MRGPETKSDFGRNVFVNCPFDADYLYLLRPLLFTILSLGFEPRIASERSDSGELRLEKICRLIGESRYGIHDLSRLQAESSGEYYRMNMPFELGIEYGSRFFSENHLGDKKFLVLAETRYEYMRAVSDLSGIDIEAHGGQEKKIVQAVRNWFVTTAKLRKIASPTTLWYDFQDFMLNFQAAREAEGFSDEDLEGMPVPEFVDFIRDWLRTNSKKS